MNLWILADYLIFRLSPVSFIKGIKTLRDSFWKRILYPNILQETTLCQLRCIQKSFIIFLEENSGLVKLRYASQEFQPPLSVFFPWIKHNNRNGLLLTLPPSTSYHCDTCTADRLIWNLLQSLLCLFTRRWSCSSRWCKNHSKDLSWGYKDDCFVLRFGLIRYTPLFVLSAVQLQISKPQVIWSSKDIKRNSR